MTPFHPASIPESEAALIMREMEQAWEKDRCKTLNFGKPLTEEGYKELIKTTIMDAANAEIYLNDLYQVRVYRDKDELVHLSIKRRDRKEIRDWRELQAIKNAILGPECEAVELYPAESRRVDTANQYHLFGHADPKYRFGFGFFEGRWVTEVPLGKSKQRDLSPEDKARNEEHEAERTNTEGTSSAVVGTDQGA